MTPLRLMIGHEPDAHWQRLARFYQDFARDEGSIATLSANAIQAAVKRQNPGYRLAAIADHGFIAWSDHPNHPIDILDIFIKRTARGQGFARHAIAALVQQYKADRAIQVAVADTNTAAQRLYTSIGFQELPVRLLFPPPGDLTPHPQFYDVESNVWLPATWPSMPTSLPQLEEAVSKGARRIWAERSIATPPNWPVHPFARCYRLGA